MSQFSGTALILIVLSDVFLTVLYPRSGKNTLSLLLSKAVWDWRERYFKCIEKLHQHNIETMPDLEAGADHYVILRQQWEPIVVTLAHYMDYSWDEIAPL